jgi:hypothetical protein
MVKRKKEKDAKLEATFSLKTLNLNQYHARYKILQSVTTFKCLVT